MVLQISQYKSPIGVLNLIADEQILLGLNLSNVKALKDGLSQDDFEKGFKEVSKIPVITDLLNDYFAGDIAAINGISVRQPGAPFSQSAWKAMRATRCQADEEDVIADIEVRQDVKQMIIVSIYFTM